MKICLFFLALILFSCSESDVSSAFTGNESVYTLHPGLEYGMGGTVRLREKADGNTVVTVTLSPSQGGMRYPVHLHRGSLVDSGAEIAAVLNAVVSEEGVSETTISHLSDETPLSYKDLIGMETCIKVHLSDIGVERDIVLAGANVGDMRGRFRTVDIFGVCKSE